MKHFLQHGYEQRGNTPRRPFQYFGVERFGNLGNYEIGRDDTQTDGGKHFRKVVLQAGYKPGERRNIT